MSRRTIITMQERSQACAVQFGACTQSVWVVIRQTVDARCQHACSLNPPSPRVTRSPCRPRCSRWLASAGGAPCVTGSRLCRVGLCGGQQPTQPHPDEGGNAPVTRHPPNHMHTHARTHTRSKHAHTHTADTDTKCIHASIHSTTHSPGRHTRLSVCAGDDRKRRGRLWWWSVWCAKNAPMVVRRLRGFTYVSS